MADRPTSVDRVSQSIGVPFGRLSVGALDTHVLMIAATSATQRVERPARRANGPRLSESLPRGLGCNANQAVHAAIEMIGCAAPPAEVGLDLPSTPIGAGFGPLKGHVPTMRKASVGDNTEVAPQSTEDGPM